MTLFDRARVGIIGCGNISDIYIENLNQKFTNTQVVALSDRHLDRAQAKARQHNIPVFESVDDLISDANVDIVLNITKPAAHFLLCKQALMAGKHVFVEKPLSIEVEEAKELVELARQKELFLGSAPDTFLGGSLQTCRALIDSGAIGTPLSATCFLAWHGPEHEHPDPAFLYQYGAGPLFDMGPYYLTALVSLIGPAKTVCGMAGTGFSHRTVSCPGPKQGTTFPVETPTHITGNILFENGVIATILTSFDIWGHSLPFIEIYGTEGTLKIPDPDRFGDPVYLLKQGESEFKKVPLTFGNTENSRGIGLSDMAQAIAQDTHHRANGEMALHVTEMIHAFLDSAEKQEYVQLQTTCERPLPLSR